MTLRWKDEPWAKNPDPLLEALEKMYLKAIRAGKIKSPAAATAKKLRIIRKWCDAVPQKSIEDACATLEVVFIPSTMAPGPAILFPIRDVTGEIRRAHIRVNNAEAYGVRYISAVSKERFVGPPWFGTDDATLLAIIQTQEVVVVEGPMDLMACRVAAPDIPSLSSLTKRLGRHHLEYLRILGVKRIRPMFDNQPTGAAATEAMLTMVKGFEIAPLLCPASDPSDALKSALKFRALSDVLRSVPEAPQTHTFVPDDELMLGGF